MGVKALIFTGAVAATLSGCGGGAGEEESEILLPYEQLSGGMVFASAAPIGSEGYDLYWAAAPAFPTLDRQATVQLTNAVGNEWQPAVSASGNAIAFSREGLGIYLITESGRVKRVSNTEGTNFKDSLPSVSADGLRVAWTREDYGKPIGETGFVEASIMLANFDGSDARVLAPKPNVVQDASRFEPTLGATKVAWSEFNAATLTVNGPSDYGVWIHDFQNGTGSLVFEGERVVDNLTYRCFGQHMAWPIPNALVLPQTFLELHRDTPQFASAILGDFLSSVTNQQLGTPITQPFPGTPQGFFRPFPLSASYLGTDRMLVDGLIDSVEGDERTLAFFISQVDGSGVWRLFLDYGRADYDPNNTAGYLFSVATPQLIP